MRKNKQSIKGLKEVGQLLELFMQEKNNNKLIFGWAKLKSHYLKSKLKHKNSNTSLSIESYGKIVQMAQNSQYIYQQCGTHSRMKSPVSYSLNSANKTSKINLNNQQILPATHEDGFQQIVLGKINQLQQAISSIKQASYANPSLADLINDNQSRTSFPSHMRHNFSDLQSRKIRLNTISPRSTIRGFNLNFYSPIAKNDQNMEAQDTSLRLQTEHDDKQQRKYRPLSTIEQFKNHKKKINQLSTKNWQPRFFKSITTYTAKDIIARRQLYQQSVLSNQNKHSETNLQSIKMKIQDAKKKINHQHTLLDHNKKLFSVDDVNHQNQTNKKMQIEKQKEEQSKQTIINKPKHITPLENQQKQEKKIQSFKIINIDYEAASALSPRVVKQQKQTHSLIDNSVENNMNDSQYEEQIEESLQQNQVSQNRKSVKNLSRKQRGRQLLKMKK